MKHITMKYKKFEMKLIATNWDNPSYSVKSSTSCNFEILKLSQYEENKFQAAMKYIYKKFKFQISKYIKLYVIKLQLFIILLK